MFICLYAHTCVCMFIHSYVHMMICLIVHSCVQTFVHVCTLVFKYNICWMGMSSGVQIENLLNVCVLCCSKYCFLVVGVFWSSNITFVGYVQILVVK